MADFLLELRSEEIPARMQQGARGELEKLFRREMSEAGVHMGEVTVWSTPRRLALIAKGLPIETDAVSEEAKGPPVGAPDQAVDGFCRKNGVTRDQLEEREVKGRATWFAVIEKPGQAVSDLLAAAIPAMIRDFSWPKSMRWGEASISSESLKWVRPLSGIVALLDGEVVPCLTDGLASGRETIGHRFHSGGVLTIDSADDYADKLRAASVIVDHEERAGIIREGARKAARAAGLTVLEDEGLVVENAGLTEWPVPLLGRFDESFLDVPPEVIQLTARVNQKYFVCEQREPDGRTKLANAFICTANIAAADPAVVVDGNRKVLAARLSDARFFWELDQKTSLEEHAKKLERITFHEKLGTVADKVERVAKLARWLCEEGIVKPHSAGPEPVEGLSFTSGDAPKDKNRASTSSARAVSELADLAEQAARLCKADLVTEMVGEFPELQGLMGGYYAEKEGLPREVSDAIRDHYKPVGQGDEVPTAPVTVAVSLADKLDTIASFFAFQEKPTGSKDPFALRRAMIGSVRLDLEVSLPRSLISLLLKAAEYWLKRHRNEAFLTSQYSSEAQNELYWHLYRAEMSIPQEAHIAEVCEGLDDAQIALVKKDFGQDLKLHMIGEDTIRHDLEFFLRDRFEVVLSDLGIAYDVRNALAHGQMSLSTWTAKARALQSFVETDSGTNLLAGYKRAANILKKENYPVTPAKAGVSGGTAQMPEMPASAGMTSDGDAIDGLGEEDPSGKDLSYTPEPAEKDLIDALDVAEPKAAAALEAEDFEAAMAALASLRAPIDRFFEDVIVNADDAAVREARLGLLARFRDAVHRVADFSRIEG
ncbi:MAG: glycine--tRNA ligase subunit beta [Pseudomonadota bacterium]